MRQQLAAQLGRFCQSKAGRDKDAIYIIIKIDGDFVFVVDGDYKKIENPKRKRLKHIRLLDNISEAIEKNLKAGKAIHDSQVSSAIRNSNLKTSFQNCDCEKSQSNKETSKNG